MEATRKIENSKYKTIPDAALRIGVGRATVRKEAEKCGAILRYGRMTRVNMEKLEKHFESLEK